MAENNQEFSEFKKMIEDKKVVSFDIFDTLLLRNVLVPKDIFKILDKEVKEKYNIDNFYNIRISSESESRTRKNNYEVKLDEIYKKISDKIAIPVEDIRQRELELEKDFICVNPFMYNLFDYCIRQKKKVILISDMYLPKKFIDELLKNCGYSNYDENYVSCEIRKSKYQGDLFEYVKDKKKIDVKDWIHVGDNEYSDINNAIKHGITTYHYKKIIDRTKYKDLDTSIESSIVTAIQINKIYNGKSLGLLGKIWYRILFWNLFFYSILVKRYAKE